MIKYFSNFIEIVIHVNLDLILVRLENVFAVERKVVAGVEHLCAVFQLGATVILFQLGQQARKNVTRLVGVIASLVELVAFLHTIFTVYLVKFSGNVMPTSGKSVILSRIFSMVLLPWNCSNCSARNLVSYTVGKYLLTFCLNFYKVSGNLL